MTIQDEPPSQYARDCVLIMIAEEENNSVSTIVRSLNLDPASVDHILEKLEAWGYIMPDKLKPETYQLTELGKIRSYTQQLNADQVREQLQQALEVLRRLRVCDAGGYNRRSARQISFQEAETYESCGRTGLMRSVRSYCDNLLQQAGIRIRN